MAVARARIASAFDLLREAAEAQLLQHYAAKLAAVSACMRPAEVAAARAQLRAERDAAVIALRLRCRLSERENAVRVDCAHAATVRALRSRLARADFRTVASDVTDRVPNRPDTERRTLAVSITARHHRHLR
jgi:fatty acid-binding protein DegV